MSTDAAVAEVEVDKLDQGPDPTSMELVEALGLPHLGRSLHGQSTRGRGWVQRAGLTEQL